MDQTFLRQSQERLLHNLFSPWQRRGAFLLQVGLEYNLHPEFFWEAGFDVTCMASSMNQIEESRKRSGPRVEYITGQATDLPFDDNNFDYTVVFYHNKIMQEVLSEVCRVSARGMIILAQNKLSLAKYPLISEQIEQAEYTSQTEQAKQAKRAGQAKHATNISSPVFPWKFFREVCNSSPSRRGKFNSVLPMPQFLWKYKNSLFNTSLLPLPLGSLMGIRIDFHKNLVSPLGLLARKGKEAYADRMAQGVKVVETIDGQCQVDTPPSSKD